MARLVDCCPSSDDELPMPDVLIRTPNVKQKKTMEQEMITPGPAPARRELVPKSTVKPSARKIRRLGGAAPLSQNPLFKRWGTEEGNGPFGMTARGKSPKKTTHLFEEDMKMEEPETTRKLQSTPELKVPSQYAASPIAAGTKSVNVTRFDVTNTSFALTPGGQNLSDRLKRSFAASPIKSRQLKFDLDSIDASEETSDDEGVASASVSAFDSSSNKSFEQDSQESLQVEEYTRFVGAGDVSSSNDSYGSESDFAQITNSITDESAINMSIDSILAVVQPIKLSLKPLDNVMKARDTNVSPVRSPLEKPKQQIAKDMELAGKENATITPSGEFPDDDFSSDAIAEQLENDCRFQTPPATPQKSNKTLLSTKKSAKIPSSPHKAEAETFWNQDYVDGWNEKHSPKKTICSPQKAELSSSSSPRKNKNIAFEASRHTLAESFLQELDQEITEGKIAELAEPTGGVSIVWTKTLNTTAGRANWKRETIKHTSEDGEKTVEYKHHASIELAEKVIDDEQKLLNVIAHEFCHLANFMVNGITNNPHGKEFKAWATKCTRAFADRGISVTTKHSYDIDFKYIWQCVECKSEYKRHSKSINPEKHRCGGCKSKLAQIKPVPRTKTKPTAYQLFIKEHMKLLREENPGVPQKEIMKMAAEKWANRDKATTETVTLEEDLLDDVVGQLGGLKLEATT